MLLKKISFHLLGYEGTAEYCSAEYASCLLWPVQLQCSSHLGSKKERNIMHIKNSWKL